MNATSDNRHASPTLYTARLTLTPFSTDDPDDLELMMATFRDPVFIQNLGDLGVHSESDLVDLLRLTALSASVCRVPPPLFPATPHFVMRLGAHCPDGKRIGCVTLGQRGAKTIPDPGWGLLSEYGGKGYATEAAVEAVRYWRDVLGVEEMMVPVDPKNRGSWRIAEKLGFVPVERGMMMEGSHLHKLYLMPGTKPPSEDAVFKIWPDERDWGTDT